MQCNLLHVSNLSASHAQVSDVCQVSRSNFVPPFISHLASHSPFDDNNCACTLTKYSRSKRRVAFEFSRLLQLIRLRDVPSGRDAWNAERWLPAIYNHKLRDSLCMYVCMYILIRGSMVLL